MSIDLSHFAPLAKHNKRGGVWVRVSSQPSISSEALQALGNPPYVSVMYSDVDDAFLIAPAPGPDEGYKVWKTRQIHAAAMGHIARQKGWSNRRYPAVMTDAGLLVRHYEEDTHHER